jgi:hypothetical protein
VAAAIGAVAHGSAVRVRLAAYPGPGSVGTRHCMGAAARAGIPVREFPLTARTPIKETTS